MIARYLRRSFENKTATGRGLCWNLSPVVPDPWQSLSRVSPGVIPCAGNLNLSLRYSRVAAIIEVLLCAVDPGGCITPISLRHYACLALVSPEILLMQTKNS